MAALCSSTAAAIVVVISFISADVPPMPRLPSDAPPVAPCIASIWAGISSVALAVCVARFLTSLPPRRSPYRPRRLGPPRSWR